MSLYSYSIIWTLSRTVSAIILQKHYSLTFSFWLAPYGWAVNCITCLPCAAILKQWLKSVWAHNLISFAYSQFEGVRIPKLTLFVTPYSVITACDINFGRSGALQCDKGQMTSLDTLSPHMWQGFRCHDKQVSKFHIHIFFYSDYKISVIIKDMVVCNCVYVCNIVKLKASSFNLAIFLTIRQ